MAVRGQDVADLETFELLCDLLDREPWVDDDGLLGARARQDITVDLAIELDLDDGELGHCISIYRNGASRCSRLRRGPRPGLPVLGLRLLQEAVEEALLSGYSGAPCTLRRRASRESNLSSAGFARGRSGYFATWIASSSSSISSGVKLRVR